MIDLYSFLHGFVQKYGEKKKFLWKKAHNLNKAEKCEYFLHNNTEDKNIQIE